MRWTRRAYPDGVEVLCPIQTWSDDFSMAVAGIPSMVNEFSGGEFMETHYHSQFDNDNVYQEPVYLFHHVLYGRLVMAFDRLLLPPMNFERLIRAVTDSDDVGIRRKAEADIWEMKRALKKAKEVSRVLYRRITELNRDYAALLAQGDMDAADRMFERYGDMQERLLYIFRKEQDYFVRLNWHDEVLFPQEACRTICARSTRLCGTPGREMRGRPWRTSTASTTTATPSSLTSRCSTISPSTC